MGTYEVLMSARGSGVGWGYRVIRITMYRQTRPRKQCTGTSAPSDR